MPDPEVVPTPTGAEGTPPPLTEGTPQPETALTRTEVAELIAAAKQEVAQSLKVDLDAAYKAARRSESKGDTANAKITKLEAALEVVATRDLTDEQARLWKAERAVERANETNTQVSAQQEDAQARSAFADRSTQLLSSEGIKANDPRLTEAFKKYTENVKSYADWDIALARAVADVHKDEAKKASTSSKEQVEKAREEERAKLRNEQRGASGTLDKGTPASAGKVDWTNMSDAEFIAHEETLKADRLRRQRQMK